MSHNPTCPVVAEECDDPGCPGPSRCVLRYPTIRLKWAQQNPDHWSSKAVLLEAFDPGI